MSTWVTHFLSVTSYVFSSTAIISHFEVLKFKKEQGFGAHTKSQNIAIYRHPISKLPLFNLRRTSSIVESIKLQLTIIYTGRSTKEYWDLGVFPLSFIINEVS